MAREPKAIRYLSSPLKTWNSRLNDKKPAEIISLCTQPASHLDDPQLQSRFFALPPEIRILIYRYLILTFGWGDAVHIVTRSQLNRASPTPWASNEEGDRTLQSEGGRLACVPCAAELGDPFQISGSHYGHWPRGHLACERIASWQTAFPFDGPPRPIDYENAGPSHLSFLLTCRQMYWEASDHLYSSLRFEPLGLEAADRFLAATTPRLLARISKFHLSWQTGTSIYVPPLPESISELERAELLDNNRDRLWGQICSNIKQLTELRELRIAIYDVTWRPTPEDDLLEPLMDIHVKGTFIVELRSTEGEHIREGDIFSRTDDLPPFQIQRRGKELDDGGNIEIFRAVTTGHRGRKGFCWYLCLPFRFVYYSFETLIECVGAGLRK